MYIPTIPLPQVRIPDVEFVVNLGDWPIESMAGNDKPLPVLSWCGSNDTYDIILPTYDLTSSTLGAMTKCVYLVCVCVGGWVCGCVGVGVLGMGYIGLNLSQWLSNKLPQLC